eukprot:c20539_g1_i1.p1 GENE.c20539_g1_i1~~c20539_g1_i1.p1  ORF type:complete len:337 (-),score=102.00 c20539_g1_i1:79-1053(-)
MKVVLAEAGKCVLSTRPIPTPTARECLVKIKVTAVNRADTLQRKGLYPAPPGETDILGLEMAGEVAEIGPDCHRGWKVGDRVMSILGGGGYAEFVSVNEDLLLPVPPAFTWEQAGAIPEVWLTAFQLLHVVGQVKPNDFVLIHAGGSGVGTAATQLAKKAGAHAIVTAGSDAKVQKCVELGAESGINYNSNPNWAEELKTRTKGHGIDVVLDCVGGSYWEQNAEAIATDARWVVYGLMGGGDVNGKLLTTLLRKRATIVGTTLRSRDIPYKALITSRFREECLSLFSSGALVPVVDRVMTLDNAQEAHEIVETNTTNGKVVLLV